ncbi:MAG: diacylglycerol kinase, partial [Rhizobiales bacterium]|nr:diacylglycerol kinase [Hyphomicrobiales bacterium]
PVPGAGARALEGNKPLAILPAGTMNLYARALKIPLDLDVAVSALAAGDLGKSDIGRANGRPFLHQFSIGFHSRMVAERNSYNFASKLGKIRASIVAAIDTIRRPPSFPIEMNIDGREVSERISSLAVSNNPYGEGHLPYADAVTSGKLGIYYARPSTAAANARMLADLTIGNVQNNPDIVQESGTRVRLSFPQKRKSAKAVIDGELVDLDPSVDIEILPGALKVILPARDKAE